MSRLTKWVAVLVGSLIFSTVVGLIYILIDRLVLNDLPNKVPAGESISLEVQFLDGANFKEQMIYGCILDSNTGQFVCVPTLNLDKLPKDRSSQEL